MEQTYLWKKQSNAYEKMLQQLFSICFCLRKALHYDEHKAFLSQRFILKEFMLKKRFD